jgi:hypothetical protein
MTLRPALLATAAVAAVSAVVGPASATWASPSRDGIVHPAGGAPVGGVAAAGRATPGVHAASYVGEGILAYGDAGFYGSPTTTHLSTPIVSMAPTPDGKGYWLVAADGGIFTFGDAAFLGSEGARPLNAAVVGMAPTPDGKGYWLVAGDGGIFTFGDATYEGSAGGTAISNSIVGMAATPDGKGYWLAGSGGAVYWYGDAIPYGGNAGAYPEAPISAIASTGDSAGYWLLEPDAFPTAFSHPATSTVVASAASQIGDFPDAGYFCNPYGPCEEWCALFATWAWNSVGVDIPRYAFTGDIDTWAAANTEILPPSARPASGDAVLYGTGPSSTSTSVHVGIVAQVWPDGAIDTVEGDSGPGPEGHYGVTINGPYLPSHSLQYNGVGIYAFAAP